MVSLCQEQNRVDFGSGYNFLKKVLIYFCESGIFPRLKNLALSHGVALDCRFSIYN
jgi:hypothetical protein